MEETRVQKLLRHHAEDIIIVTDKHGYIVWINDCFTRLTEYLFEEVKGKKPGSFLQGEESHASEIHKMREAISAGQGFNVNIVNYSKTGKKYWLNINCIPIFDDSHEIEHFVAIERDITSEYEQNQKKLNKLIEEQEKLSSEKSQLIEWVYALAHDLKAPLDNIERLSEILNTENKTALDLLQNEVSRSKDLIHKILPGRQNISKKINVEMSTFSVLEIIQKLTWANETSILDKKLKVHIDCPTKARLHSDRVLFTQIIENLFVNSLKYAAEASQVDFKVREERNTIIIILSNETDLLEDWQLKKLFEPFQNFNTQFTDQSKGMGLYIVKKYLGLIGGQIDVSKTDQRVFFEASINNTYQA